MCVFTCLIRGMFTEKSFVPARRGNTRTMNEPTLAHRRPYSAPNKRRDMDLESIECVLKSQVRDGNQRIPKDSVISDFEQNRTGERNLFY